MIDEFIERDEEGERVDGDAVGADSDKKRDGFRKGGIESRLGVQEFKRAEVRRVGGVEEARTADIRGERAGRAGAAAAVPRTMN